MTTPDKDPRNVANIVFYMAIAADLLCVLAAVFLLYNGDRSMLPWILIVLGSLPLLMALVIRSTIARTKQE